MDNTNKTFSPLSNEETAAFCSQMAMVLKAGISSIEGASILLDDAKTDSEKVLMNAIYQTLLETGSLYLALDDTKAFPDYMISMVQIGEQTGRMDEVMNSLASYYEKEANLLQTIKNAITYPFIMVLMMISVVLVLIMKVMPIFNEVFTQLGTEMYGVSKLVLDFGLFLNKHIAIIIILLIILIGIGFYFLKTKHGQKVFLQFCGKFSFTAATADKISAYRFANGMALTLSSGLTPEESLNLSADLISDPAFKKKLDDCKEKVSQGEDLSESLMTCGIFTGLYKKMAVIASRAGVMDEVLTKIALHLEEEIDNSINRILATIEPTLVVVLSVIVGLILLSVMMPLISIMTTL